MTQKRRKKSAARNDEVRALGVDAGSLRRRLPLPPSLSLSRCIQQEAVQARTQGAQSIVKARQSQSERKGDTQSRCASHCLDARVRER